MGLTVLVLGLAIFIANHLFVTFRGARAAAIARLGKPVYHALFGIVSLVGLALIVWGFADYRANAWTQVWTPPAFMHHVTIGLMLIASILIAAYLIPSHIKARARHPLLAAVKVWAFAHLLSNGDLGSMIMFGALLAWAVYAYVTAKYRTDVVLPVAPRGWKNDVAVLIAGIAIFLALGYWFHPHVIGVPVFTR
ncbi:MAG TPA: NnrU family protein [Pseudolabrys sp.]|jgi:uncharacterized membrane protein|nr:NnrU family protein [Pseudolabrys sp.]